MLLATTTSMALLYQTYRKKIPTVFCCLLSTNCNFFDGECLAFHFLAPQIFPTRRYSSTHRYSTTMPPPRPTPVEFETMGRELARYNYSTSIRIQRDRFVTFFGIEPLMCSIVWELLLDTGKLTGVFRPKPAHLLWTLHWLQCYRTNPENAAQFGCDEKTFCKWIWFYSGVIADLDELLVSAGMSSSLLVIMPATLYSCPLPRSSSLLTDPLARPLCWRHRRNMQGCSRWN